MEENKTNEVMNPEEKTEKKAGFFSKVKNFIGNPAKGRPIKNMGWMLGGAGILMLAATLLTGKNSDDGDSDEESDE